MYGKGTKMIDVTNVNQITKTMNQLFPKINEKSTKKFGFLIFISYIRLVILIITLKT